MRVWKIFLRPLTPPFSGWDRDSPSFTDIPVGALGAELYAPHRLGGSGAESVAAGRSIPWSAEGGGSLKAQELV